jgi:hypothetical protein
LILSCKPAITAVAADAVRLISRNLLVVSLAEAADRPSVRQKINPFRKKDMFDSFMGGLKKQLSKGR